MQPGPSQLPLVRIVLADDHDLVRSGIKALLAHVPGVEVVGEARDGLELLAIVAQLQPDIAMTDLTMPAMDGMSAIAKLHELHPALRIVVVSTHDTADFIKRAVASGACGYLTKDASPSEMEQTLRGVMNRGSHFGSPIVHRLLQPSEPAVEDELTARQIEIITLLAQGMASKEIAFKLGLSSKTVDVHRSRAMERLGLQDLASLIRYAIRKKLIQA